MKLEKLPSSRSEGRKESQLMVERDGLAEILILDALLTRILGEMESTTSVYCKGIFMSRERREDVCFEDVNFPCGAT